MARLPGHVLKKVERVNVDAPFPYLRRGRPSRNFNLLRAEVQEQCGFDFLAKVDLLRPRGFISSNPNVSKRSRHICADSFDFDPQDTRYIAIKEPQGGLQFWRIFLRCEAAAEHGGLLMSLQTDAGRVRGHFVDFTSLAEAYGFKRIPAWVGWSNDGPNARLRAFWHFECTDGFTWDEAVGFLYGSGASPRPIRMALIEKVLGLNDRMPEIKNLQAQLVKLGYLRRDFPNEIFDLDTEAGVKKFQSNVGLPANGIVDSTTRFLLMERILTLCSPTRVWPEK